MHHRAREFHPFLYWATVVASTTVGTTLAEGSWLNAATATKPVCVLGAAAAQRLGIDKVLPGERIWIDNQWFYVAGILNPAVLAPQIDGSILVGIEAAATYLGFDRHPTEIYVRSITDQTTAVHGVLGATANPAHPDAAAYAVYYWLTYLQGELVEQLLGYRLDSGQLLPHR